VIAICNIYRYIPEVTDAILLGGSEDSAACPILASTLSTDPDGEMRNAYWRWRQCDGVRVGITGCVLKP
jgi:hypothetical protein